MVIPTPTAPQGGFIHKDGFHRKTERAKCEGVAWYDRRQSDGEHRRCLELRTCDSPWLSPSRP